MILTIKQCQNASQNIQKTVKKNFPYGVEVGGGRKFGILPHLDLDHGTALNSSTENPQSYLINLCCFNLMHSL